FEPLGVIRTEELLQARRLDGAEQYFTRAFDYGFSKTLGEAKSKWPEDVIKCDAVSAIRLFRPLVVISRFTGTPQDGHGQHQYAGYIAPIAVKAAADPQQCKDAGEAWTVKKFYIETGFSDNSEPTLKINTGALDPILGRTYFEIAMEGRSQHRSQGEGRIEFHGDSFSGLNLVAAAKDVREKDIFDGLDTSISGLSKLFPSNNPMENVNALGAAQAAAREALRQSTIGDPLKLIPTLIAGEKAVNLVVGSPDARPSEKSEYVLWTRTRRLFQAATARAAGVQVDALADSETVVPGDVLMVSVKTFVPIVSDAHVVETTLSAPVGWTVTKIDPPKQSNAAYNTRESPAAGAVFNVTVDRSAHATQPYWLSDPRDGGLFRWPDTDSRTLPFDPPQLVAHVHVNVGGTDIVLDQPVQYRFADPARGEIRRNIDVVPGLSVAVDRDLLVVPVSDKPQTRRLVVSVTNNTSKERGGHVSLNIAVSPEWKVDVPQGSLFSLKTRGAKASIPFDITIPPRISAGTVAIRASAEVGMDPPASLTMNVVPYPHIQTHRYYTPADTTIRVLDLKTVPLNVGYVMGSGDEVPEAIRQMGMKVTMLEEQDLASGDLSKFDTIVVGIRASETRPDLVANNVRLLDYAKGGGNVIVLYQRFNWTGLAPYPVNIQDKQGTTAGSIARVVDENAKVTILDPQNTIFNSPNKITDSDFAGWVQERNAYNLVTFDPQYTPLLESHDAGEQENKGGLVVAKVGRGTWVYCSYSFFRQLPAGVPGAYRLFDNLLSLQKAR
ncbi:MAG TPA: hypothetical protein VGO43_00140, partial [Pyrinomonadaceae bacterium]|nr:hypothetical protein [Pyrinomonadaceae bacterium]